MLFYIYHVFLCVFSFIMFKVSRESRFGRSQMGFGHRANVWRTFLLPGAARSTKPWQFLCTPCHLHGAIVSTSWRKCCVEFVFWGSVCWNRLQWLAQFSWPSWQYCRRFHAHRYGSLRIALWFLVHANLSALAWRLSVLANGLPNCARSLESVYTKINYMRIFWQW